MTIIERFYQTQQDMQHSALANTEYQLEKAIQFKSKATLLVSGGSTPKPLYQALSQSPLSWKNIQVAMVDERWVEVNHPASNEKFIRENLLVDKAYNANFQTMKTQNNYAIEAVDALNQQYQFLNQVADVTIIGMGGDGHTASLFPDADGLESAISNTNFCTAIKAKPSEVTGDYCERLSLSLNGLKQTKLLKLLITGKDKLNVYRQALTIKDKNKMPIAYLLQQSAIPICVYWAP